MATFFTFYSFKGGVGRSMALANVADILARRGLRVLAIDFDLEAPGLERYFQVEKTAALANPGLIDLLQSFKKSLSGADAIDDSAQFRQLERFIFPVFQRPLPNGGELNLLTAGQREPASQYRQYALAVRTFDWQDFYYNWEGEAFFEWLRGELATPSNGGRGYDVVLVDSRTGVTEMGGVCAYQLADVIVMLCAANHQNVEGTREVARDFRSESVRALRRGRPLEMVVVPARIEKRDDGLLEKFFQRFNDFFLDEEPSAFNAAGLSFRDLTIPYQPEYAFEEIVVSDPERRESRRDIGGAFERLADALTLLASPGENQALAAQREVALEAILASLARPAEAHDSEPGTPLEQAPESATVGNLRKTASSTHFDPTRRFAGYDVFLSFGREDHERILALNAALSAAGLNVFLTSSALTPGDQIAESTAQAIHHSRFLLVCAGNRGIGQWQKREIELAQSSNQPIRIVPVLLHGAEQDIFSLALRGVANMQAIDLRHWPQDSAAFSQLLQLLRDDAKPRNEDSTAPVKAENPYAGLQAYDEGRVHLLDLADSQLAALAAMLRETGLAVLFGATGVGKGSLVAALLAQLRRDGLIAGTPLSVLRLKMADPEARQRIEAPPEDKQLLVIEDIDHLPAALNPPGQSSLWPAALAERIRHASPERPVLLVGNDLPLAGWRQPPSPDAALWQRLQAAISTLPPPDAEAVRRAIETPAVRSGYAFEPGLLDRLAKDAADGPAALPLAQMVLSSLWPQAVRGFLTNAAYDACGGIAGVFGAYVESRLEEVPPQLADAVNALLLRLVSVADDGSINWQAATWEHVRSMPVLAERGGEALLWLLDTRLISVWRASPEQLMFSLLRPLGAGNGLQLYALIAGATDNLVRRRRLVSSLGMWLERKREPDALLTGYRQDDACDLLRDWPEQLSNEERIFIARSVERTKARRERSILIGVAVAVAVALTSALIGTFVYMRKTDTYERNLTAANDDIQAAVAAIKASIGQAESEGKFDASPFNGARIYTQYRDQRDKDTVGALAFSLRALGLPVEPIEWTKETPTCGEVRFFHNGDDQRARELAVTTGRMLKTLGYDFEPDIYDLSASRFGKDKPGTLEIWLPPLRTLAIAANTAQPTNSRDGADLRLVPASCARIGSRTEARKTLADQLNTPYAKIYDNDLEAQETWVDGFLIYRHEVTNEQFGRFQSSCLASAAPGCPGDWRARGKPREPARFLAWSAADAYCRWAGGRLPNEIEWEKAARGKKGQTWPWGNEPEAQRFQGRETSGGRFIAEVGHFPAGDSPYGVADLAGNVWEMTASPWPGGGHVMKGGSYLNPLMEARSAWRWVSSSEDKGADYLGFRCVVDLGPTAVR